LATKATEFGKITPNNGHYGIQNHQFWYQSKAHMQLRISDYSHLALFPRYSLQLVKSLHLATPLAFNLTAGSSGTISVKICMEVRGWLRYKTA